MAIAIAKRSKGHSAEKKGANKSSKILAVDCQYNA